MSRTPLQSAFFHNQLNVAGVLLAANADIEHIDNDGFSVLLYLWVVEEALETSVEFQQLCKAHDFKAINNCDKRGWSPFHRAAAIGNAGDVNMFIKLDALLKLKANWYSWTPLSFAASHDNVETFEEIIRHLALEPDAYHSLDKDGWNLLHCCVYFGASKVMRFVLKHGVDVHQRTLPSRLPEDPELTGRKLTAYDIAMHMGPRRYKMYAEALVATGHETLADK